MISLSGWAGRAATVAGVAGAAAGAPTSRGAVALRGGLAVRLDERSPPGGLGLAPLGRGAVLGPGAVRVGLLLELLEGRGLGLLAS